MKIEIPNWRPPKTLVAYCDESSQTGNRYFVVGASFFIPKNPDEANKAIDALEEGLKKIKKKFNINDTVKWEKVPTPGQYQEGYKQFLLAFLNFPAWYFRCMVVDTRRYPLNHRIFMGGDTEIGYLKFYCVFLSDGLMKNKPDYFFDIRIDRYEFRPGNDSSDLEQSVAGRFAKRAKPEYTKYLDSCKVTVLDTTQHCLLQLTDLLVGAVAFVWNGGMDRNSKKAKAKSELVKLIQEKRRVDLRKPCKPWEEGFNIWEFKV